ncbi:MAG TPA: hypothetical protein VK791_00385 [bacterium]|nr:hypothetical protein [bacterium]
MKSIAAFTASMILVGSTCIAMAQDATPGTGSKHTRNPAVEKIFKTIKTQKNQITADVTNGKLTADMANTINAKLKSIEDEIKADFKQNKKNGTRGLTDSQIETLNQELTANAANIP